MLYNININQEAAIRSGLPLIFQHLAIVNVLKNMFSSSDIQEIWHDGKSFKWVAIDLIISELPLLELKKRRVSELLAELEDMRIIMRHPQNQQLRKSFFRAGTKWNSLFSSMQKSAEPSMQKNADHYAEKCVDAMQKSADYYNTINHTTNQKNTDFVFSENEPHPAVIENRRKALAKPEEVKPPFDSDKAKESWQTWVAYLVEKGKNPTRTTLEAHARELRNHSEATALAMIKQAIETGNVFPYPLTKFSASNSKDTSAPKVGSAEYWKQRTESKNGTI